MKCTNSACGQPVRPDWKQCRFCGTPVAAKTVCQGCGNALEPEWRLCPFCDLRVNQGMKTAGSPLKPGSYWQGCGTEILPGTGKSFKCEECGGIFCAECRVLHLDGRKLPFYDSCGHAQVAPIIEKRRQEAELKAAEEHRKKEEARTCREAEKQSLGIIPDPKGRPLEWYVGPDQDIDWNDANIWVKNLTADGGGWRLPSLKELKGLYEEGKGSANMHPDFGTFSVLFEKPWVWSGEIKDSLSAWRFSFFSGQELWYDRVNGYCERVFAVRSRG